jgi:hypothetical protein
VLLYADGEDAVMHAEATRVVAKLMEHAVDKLDTDQPPPHSQDALRRNGLR